MFYRMTLNCLKALMILLVIRTGFAQAQAQTQPTARVFEYSDQWTQSLGAAKYLEQAGFQVAPLPLDQSPSKMQTDLIFIGSFASQNPDYHTYMKQYADDLCSYVNQSHLLVQMVQADQTEKTPPFLPATHGARREDRDFPQAHILSPRHHLLGDLTFGFCLT